jgi:hypothetical protein
MNMVYIPNDIASEAMRLIEAKAKRTGKTTDEVIHDLIGLLLHPPALEFKLDPDDPYFESRLIEQLAIKHLKEGSTKIPLDDGSYLEPDEGPRNTRFHKRIVRFWKLSRRECERILAHACGNDELVGEGYILELECGHDEMVFGNLAHAEGVALCTKCRDLEEQIRGGGVTV